MDLEFVPYETVRQLGYTLVVNTDKFNIIFALSKGGVSIKRRLTRVEFRHMNSQAFAEFLAQIVKEINDALRTRSNGLYVG